MIESVFFLIKHLEKSLVFKFVFDVRIFNDICAIFDENVKTGGFSVLIIELYIIVIFFMDAVGEQNLDNFDQELSDAID